MKILLIILMSVIAWALVVILTADPAIINARQTKCEKQGGIYLYREAVCLRADALLELK